MITLEEWVDIVALRRIGELSMENELLHERIERPGPLGARRSRR